MPAVNILLALKLNLRQKNVDLNIIQEAMGHETQLQTMTYLDETDDSLIAKSIEVIVQQIVELLRNVQKLHIPRRIK